MSSNVGYEYKKLSKKQMIDILRKKYQYPVSEGRSRDFIEKILIKRSLSVKE